MYLGGPTGAAMPLMWAHAEYIKLLRSAVDGQVFDSIPAVAERYHSRCGCQPLEIWKPNRRIRSIRAGMTLRVQSPASFQLRWTRDGWQTTQETRSVPTALGIEYVDLAIPPDQRAPINFTFFWTNSQRWEERNYEVVME